jgi:cell division septal protein FtsQ
MSSVLYYSEFCQHCKNLLRLLSKSKTKDNLHFICIDIREKQSNGETHIILENGQKLLLPSTVNTVPSLLLLNNGNKVLGGIGKVMEYLKPQQEIEKKIATKSNMEPLAFSTSEMGTIQSDNFSYLDLTADDLSAKGNGGLRMMHNYTGWEQNTTIATPPDDYVPNKVGNVDMGKLQEKRNTEVSGKR